MPPATWWSPRRQGWRRASVGRRVRSGIGAWIGPQTWTLGIGQLVLPGGRLHGSGESRPRQTLEVAGERADSTTVHPRIFDNQVANRQLAGPAAKDDRHPH